MQGNINHKASDETLEYGWIKVYITIIYQTRYHKNFFLYVMHIANFSRDNAITISCSLEVFFLGGDSVTRTKLRLNVRDGICTFPSS